MAPRSRSRMLVLADNDEDEDEDDTYDEDDDDEDEGDDDPQRMNKADQLFAHVAQLSKNQQDLALAVGTIAKAQKRILRLAESSMLSKHDPMAGGAGVPGQPMPPGAQPGAQPSMTAPPPPPLDDEDEQNQPPPPPPGQGNLNLSAPRPQGMPNFRDPSGRDKVMKDDSSSNFGEIDDDEPGNRPYDQKNVGETDTLITGKPGTGPGPLSSTSLRKAIVGDVLAELQKAGITPTDALASAINKAVVGPTPGAPSTVQTNPNPYAGAGLPDYTASLLNKAADGDLAAGIEAMVALPGSFAAINRARVELIPGSLTPFPVFGQGFGGAGGVADIPIR